MNVNQFEQEVLKLQGNMFSFAMTLAGNKEDAGDLLQDTTLKVLNNRDKYMNDVNLKGWILTVMRNIFINNYRKVVRNQTIIVQTENLYHLNLSQNSGFETPEGAFTIKDINRLINELNSDLKMPFSLFLAGYKYEEIAEKLSLPLGTVKSRIFFARRKLQSALKDMR